MHFAPTTANPTSVEDKRISPLSFFHDDEWRFETTQPGKPYSTVNWAIPLADGSLLTDPKNRAWLNACKHLLYHVIESTFGVGRPLRARSIMSRAGLFRQFITLMSEHGVYTFRDLTPARVIALRNDVDRASVKKRRGHGHFEVTDKKWSESYRQQAIFFLKTLVMLQSHIPDGADLPRELADQLTAGLNHKHARGRTPRIPDHVFVQLLEASVKWVRDIGPLLLARNALLLDIKKTARSEKIKVRQYKAFYETASTATLVNVGGREHDVQALASIQVNSWLSHLVAATAVVIAGLTGMRLSEILSLRRNCLDTMAIADGRKLLRLKGTLYKTSRCNDGELAYWIAGWDDTENPIRCAIEALERLQSRHGNLDSNILLFTPLPEFARGDTSQQGRSSRSLAFRVNKFAEFNGISGWLFAMHQFRKTFARFVTLSNPKAILALQRHFKHVSITMTERYLPTDPDLLDEIIEQSFEVDAERLDSILQSNRLAGLKGEEILKRNAEFRGNTASATSARKACIQSTMQDPSFRMVRHVYGDCFYEATSAKCAGRVANVGLNTCVGCKNFSVEPGAHLTFWEEQLRAVEADLAEIEALGQESDDLEAQRDIAAEIIRKLANG